MRKFLIISSILMMSSAVLAQEVETCADGAGTVIIGAVSGHKYCKSNKGMNWWNAHAWCDALNRRLFSLDDCENSNTGSARICNDLSLGDSGFVWTSIPNSVSQAFYVDLSSGGWPSSDNRRTGYCTLCY